MLGSGSSNSDSNFIPVTYETYFDWMIPHDGISEYEVGYNILTNKTQVSPKLSGTTGVFIIAGESIASNSVNSNYTITHTNTYMLNVYNGGLYVLSDPMLGTTQGYQTDPYTGNPMTMLGDFIAAMGWYTNVVMVNISVGGSHCINWRRSIGDLALNNGDANRKFAVVKNRLNAIGLTPTAVLYQQGVNDCSNGFASNPTEVTSYTTSTQNVVDSIRADISPTCPIFIALQAFNTIGSPTDVATMRNIQLNTIANNANCYQGADTDAIPVGQRWDGLHLGSTGAFNWAIDWRNKIGSVLFP